MPAVFTLAVCLKTYCSLFFFSLNLSHRFHIFLGLGVGILCLCVFVCTHHLCAFVRETWFYQCSSVVKQKWSKWYPELRHQTPEASWVMAHRSTARTKGGGGFNGMEIVEERDRWSRQKTSSPVCRQILFGVWGSGVYVSQDLEEKLLPWEKEWKEKEREGCKRMCGALRV